MNNNRKIKTLLLAAALGLGTAGMTGMPVDAQAQNGGGHNRICNNNNYEAAFKIKPQNQLLELGEGQKSQSIEMNDSIKIGTGHSEKVYRFDASDVGTATYTVESTNEDVAEASVVKNRDNSKIAGILINPKAVGKTAVTVKVKYKFTPRPGSHEQPSYAYAKYCFVVTVEQTDLDLGEYIDADRNLEIVEKQEVKKWNQSEFTVKVPVKIASDMTDAQKDLLVDDFLTDYKDKVSLYMNDTDINDYFLNVNEASSFVDAKLVEDADGNFNIEATYAPTTKKVTGDYIDVLAKLDVAKPVVEGEDSENFNLVTEKGAGINIVSAAPRIDFIFHNGPSSDYANVELEGYVGDKSNHTFGIVVPELKEVHELADEEEKAKLIKELKEDVAKHMEVVGYDIDKDVITENKHISAKFTVNNENTEIIDNVENNYDHNEFFLLDGEFTLDKYADHHKYFAIGNESYNWWNAPRSVEMENLAVLVRANIFKQEIVTNDTVTINLKNGKADAKNIEAALHFGMDKEQKGFSFKVADSKIAKVEEVQPNKRDANTDNKFFKVTGLKKGTTTLELKLEDQKIVDPENNNDEKGQDIGTHNLVDTNRKVTTKKVKIVVNDTVTAKPEAKCAVIKRNAQGKVTYVKQCYRNGNVERETFYYYKKDGKTLVKTVNKEYAFKTNKRLVKQTVYENYKGGKWTKRTITHKHDNKANRTYSTRVLNKHANGRTKNLTYKIFHKNGKLRQHKYDAYNKKGQKTKHFNKQYFATGVLRHDYQYSKFVKGKHTKRVFKRFNERKVILSKEVATFKNGKFIKKTTYRYNKKGQLKGGKNLRAWRTITTYRKGKAHRTVRHDYTRSGRLVRS